VFGTRQNLEPVKAVFPGVPISYCYFHRGQSLYQKIQDDGLQVAYNDAEDRTIKEYSHIILALANVPLANVSSALAELRGDVPDELLDVVDYFRTTYVHGRPARGRRVPFPLAIRQSGGISTTPL